MWKVLKNARFESDYLFESDPEDISPCKISCISTLQGPVSRICKRDFRDVHFESDYLFLALRDKSNQNLQD